MHTASHFLINAHTYFARLISSFPYWLYSWTLSHTRNKSYTARAAVMNPPTVAVKQDVAPLTNITGDAAAVSADTLES